MFNTPIDRILFCIVSIICGIRECIQVYRKIKKYRNTHKNNSDNDITNI